MEVPVILDGTEFASDTSLDVLRPLGELELATLLQVLGVCLDEGSGADIADGKTLGHLEIARDQTERERERRERRERQSQPNTTDKSRAAKKKREFDIIQKSDASKRHPPP